MSESFSRKTVTLPSGVVSRACLSARSEVFGSDWLVRTSTRTPTQCPPTDTRHLAPVHLASSSRAEPPVGRAASTRSTGVTISWSDTPPWVYSMEARKHPAPGGLAIVTSGFQYHLNVGALI